jgi:TrmH family RNA methyltransferase
VLDRVLSTVSPQPIAAVVARPVVAATPITVEEGAGPVVVLAGVGDPGNVGTIIRSSVAAGARAVVVGPGSADPFGPKAIRSSVGSVFEAEIHEPDDLADAIGALRDVGWTVLGAAPRGGTAHYLADLVGPVALVLGGETAGLPPAIAGDSVVTIRQLGPAESMNVAMAATVLLFEAARQRNADDGP